MKKQCFYRNYIVFILSMSVIGLNFWAQFYPVEFSGLIRKGILSSEDLLILSEFIIISILTAGLLLCSLSFYIVNINNKSGFFFEALNNLLRPFHLGLFLTTIFFRPFLIGHIETVYQWNIEITHILFTSLLIFTLTLITHKLLNAFIKLLESARIFSNTTKLNKLYAVYKYHNILIIILLVGYVIFIMFESWKYYYVNRNADLAIFSQVIWNIAHGNGFLNTIQGVPMSYWGIHFMPVLYVYSLLSFLEDIIGLPLLLNLIHTVIVASGAIPIYLLALRRFNSKIVGSMLSASYLLYFPLLFVLIIGFQMDTIGIVLLIWAFYFFDSKRKNLANVLLILAVLHKEELALMAICIYLYLYLKRQEAFKVSLMYGTIFLIYYMVAKYIVLTNANSEISVFTQHYGYLGKDISSIVFNIVTHPAILFREIFSLRKLTHFVLVFLPFTFTAFVGIDAIIISFPLLAILLLSMATEALIFYHVVVWLILPLLVGVISFMDKLKLKGTKSYISLSISVFVSAILCNVFFGPFGYNVPRLYQHIDYRPTNNITVEKLMQKIPKTAGVAVPMNWLMTSFSTRKTVYPFPPMYDGDKYTYSMDYIIINSGLLSYNTDLVRILREEYGYVIKDVIDNCYIFTKDEVPEYLFSVKVINIPLESFELQRCSIANGIYPSQLDIKGIAEVSIPNSIISLQDNTKEKYSFYSIRPLIEVGTGGKAAVYLYSDAAGYKKILDNLFMSTDGSRKHLHLPFNITRLIKLGTPYTKIKFELSVNSLKSNDTQSCKLKMLDVQILGTAPKMPQNGEVR